MTKPSLGIWKVIPVTGPHDGRNVYQITRDGSPIGDTWIFRGQAVREKTRLMRAEGAAVRDAIRASYAKSA